MKKLLLIIFLILINTSVWIAFWVVKDKQEEIVVGLDGSEGWSPIIEQNGCLVKQ